MMFRIGKDVIVGGMSPAFDGENAVPSVTSSDSESFAVQGRSSLKSPRHLKHAAATERSTPGSAHPRTPTSRHRSSVPALHQILVDVPAEAHAIINKLTIESGRTSSRIEFDNMTADGSPLNHTGRSRSSIGTAESTSSRPRVVMSDAPAPSSPFSVSSANSSHRSRAATLSSPRLGVSGSDLGLRLESAITLDVPAVLPDAAAFSDADTPKARSARTTQAGEGVFAQSNDTDDMVITEEGFLELQGFRVHESGIVMALNTEGVVDKSSSLTGIDFRDVSVRVEVLGKGASGTVYKMVHVPTLTLVAAKSIPIYDVSKRHSVESELRTLYANLTPFERITRPTACDELPSAPCPYIVSFYDAFVNATDGTLTFVMEYMDGGSLEDIIRTGGTRDESVLANISWRVLQGLKFIHERKLIHRDIKPSNILINHVGDVKLTDFGVIRELEADEKLARTFVGTFSYMSPERIAGKEYSHASDIWSFGLCILTCALGREVLPSASFWKLLETLETTDVPLPSTDEHSPDFVNFVTKCLARNPDDRPSAAELLEHPFLTRVRRESPVKQKDAAPDVSQADNEGTISELKEIAKKVQEYRLIAAYKTKQEEMSDIPEE